ncbi:hypothetical protein JCM10212_004074 [Sporobolomyces blumeae]
MLLRTSLVAPLLAFLSAASVSSSPTTSQLREVFPTTSTDALQGSTKTVNGLEVTVVTNSTHALWSLNSTKTAVDHLGWASVGLGSKMSNADYLIAWPTVSGSSVSWTLSHRIPGGGSHDQPKMASSASATDTSAFYTPVTALTTTTTGAPYTTVAWLRALQVPSDYPTSSSVSNANVDRTQSLKMIYASASKDPSSTSQNANVAQHNNAFGSFSLDIAQPLNLAATNPTGGKASTSGWTHRDKVLIAHAVIGSVAVMLVVPFGVLLARFGRAHSWYPAHRAIQIAAALLMVTSAIIGITQNMDGGGADDHRHVGIALLILFVVQPALGLWSHRTPAGSKLTSARPSFSRPFPSVVRIVHIVLGIVLVGVGYWQVNSGFDAWQSSSDRQDSVPLAVKVVFWILLVIAVVLYVAGWAIGCVKSRKEQKENKTAVQSQDDSFQLVDHNKFATSRA